MHQSPAVGLHLKGLACACLPFTLLDLQDSGISFITWAPSVNGRCDYDPSVNLPDCGGNKVGDVAAGGVFIDAEIPYGSCTGAPICVYAHDGQLKKGSGGAPEPNVPPSCYSSSNQLCAMCGPFVVTVRRCWIACRAAHQLFSCGCTPLRMQCATESVGCGLICFSYTHSRLPLARACVFMCLPRVSQS